MITSDAQKGFETICSPPTNSDDEVHVAKIDNSDEHKEIYQISRYTPETQLKIELAMFIRQVNMNKKDSNALLNLIREISET